jgi:dephospho-CoA kinase
LRALYLFAYNGVRSTLAGQGVVVMPFVIGLTGNIASGKTTVGRMLLELGAQRYIDADLLVHQLYEPGQPVYQAVVALFGPTIVDERGTLNRRALGEVVFNDPEALRRLERIVHPAVHSAIAAELQKLPDKAIAIVDAVKLLEGGSARFTHSRWLVICSPEEQLRRLIELRGFTEAEARARLQVQPPVEPKLKLVDEVIDNSGNLATTRAQVNAAFARFCRRFGLSVGG